MFSAAQDACFELNLFDEMECDGPIIFIG